jgi:hypothetical protein
MDQQLLSSISSQNTYESAVYFTAFLTFSFIAVVVAAALVEADR